MPDLPGEVVRAAVLVCCLPFAIVGGLGFLYQTRLMSNRKRRYGEHPPLRCPRAKCGSYEHETLASGGWIYSIIQCLDCGQFIMLTHSAVAYVLSDQGYPVMRLEPASLGLGIVFFEGYRETPLEQREKGDSGDLEEARKLVYEAGRMDRPEDVLPDPAPETERAGIPRPLWYFNGYPLKHLRHKVRLVMPLVFFYYPVGMIMGTVWETCLRSTMSAERKGGALVIFLAALSAVTLRLAWDLIMDIRGPLHEGIIPYFEEKKPAGTESPYAWLYVGVFAGRHCRELDRLATGLGVPPISAFGFKDDFEKQVVEWHAASQCLVTVRALAEALGSDPKALPESDLILRDLMRYERLLSIAAEAGIRFCFLLREHCDYVSGLEFERRKGHFW